MRDDLADAVSTSPLTNRNILITGGTGSFGRAFVQRALEVGARRVVVFSRDELKQSDLRASMPDVRLRFMLGSVTEPGRLARAMRGVEFVVHAAAMKHVPACEDNPWEAVATNVLGTQYVAAAALEAGVERGIFLSTDKAAGPNTLYGATKLTAERIWIQANVYAAGTRTRFAATRYGNVLGSRGSVVPVFRAQQAAGRLTMTDPTMTRFWMALSEAVALVERAFTESRGGEIFIPKVPACDIRTVAEAVAPGVPWDLVGIRPGEKAHETLITADEARACYDCGTHYVLEPVRSWEWLPPRPEPPVPAGFEYRSDTNPDQFTVARLRELLAGGHAAQEAA